MKSRTRVKSWYAFVGAVFFFYVSVTAVSAAPPINDNFDSAVELSGNPLYGTSSFDEATKEAGEPDHDGITGGTSVWWSWTATSNDTVALYNTAFGYCLSSEIYHLGVYVGDAVDNLTAVTMTRSGNTMYLSPIAGTTYYIAVDAESSAFDSCSTGGDPFSLQITPYTPAPNDGFADATILTENAGILTGHNIGATMEPGEFSPGSAIEYGNSKTVWYRWTPSSSDPASFNADLQTTQATVALYTGNAVDSLNLVSNSIGNSGVSFNPTAGTAYSIVVAGHIDAPGTGSGEFNFSLSQHPTPPNDNFSDAQIINSELTTGHNHGASLESQESWDYGIPDYYGSFNSVWYKWIATSENQLTIELDGIFKGAIAVFTGKTVDNLTRIASGLESVTFTPIKGEEYYIVVNGKDGSTGDFTIKLPMTNTSAWNLFLPPILTSSEKTK